MSMSSHFVKTAITTSVACVLFCDAPSAFAHVTVQPDEATKGGYAAFVLRVPDESDTAGTVKLEAKFPEEHTLTSVRTKPVPGWSAAQTKRTLRTPIQSHGAKITEVVDTVTWTAEPGIRIAPGEYNEFPLSVGRLPDNTDRLLITAAQTYDDGRVVAWDMTPTSGEEPERPAPMLKLVASAGGENGHGGSARMTSTGTDNTARLLGGIGLGVGALGLGIGVGSLARGRKKA
jgi:uncharacterized protein YcnI